MKKLLFTLAVVACAAVVQADSYLYWMLDETPSSSATGYNPKPTFGEYTVKVKNGDNYLTFANPGMPDGLNETYAVQDFTYYSAGADGAASFIIELYNSEGAEAAYRATFGAGSLASYVRAEGDHAKILHIAASSFTAVPEPTSGMMLLVGAMLLGLKRKKLA